MRESNARPSTEVGMTHWTRWSAMAVVASLITVPLGAQSHTVVTNDMLRNAAGSGDWLMYGHNYSNNRFSPLKQINIANVKHLIPLGVYTHGAERLGSFETTPIVVNGTMYITSPVTPNNVVRAFDLRTQKMLWQYEHKTAPVSTACCGPNNRGVAVANGMVYVAALDGEMIALDQQTGKEKWAVEVGDPAAGYTFTMAPLAVGDKVIVGTSGGEYGIRGWVKAFNGATGALVWTWYTIPSPEEGGWWGVWAKTTPEGNDLHRDIAKEKADSAKYPDAWGNLHASGRQRRLGVVPDRREPGPRLRVHGRPASADALQDPLRAVGEGSAVAGLRLLAYPGR